MKQPKRKGATKMKMATIECGPIVTILDFGGILHCCTKTGIYAFHKKYSEWIQVLKATEGNS
jgi:hypothetical protein